MRINKRIINIGQVKFITQQQYHNKNNFRLVQWGTQSYVFTTKLVTQGQLQFPFHNQKNV